MAATESATKTRKTNSRPSSQQRREDILDATRTLISEEGFEQLSLRKVASKVGIHLKTLQHYFPSKEELIHNALFYTDALYERTYEALRPGTNDPEEHFEKSMDYLLNDDKDKLTAGFFYQLWARAHTDPQANAVMRKMYGNHCANIAHLMEPLCPGMDEETRKQRSLLIAALIDGMMLFIGYGKERPEGIGDIEQQIIALTKKLASDPEFLKT